MSITNKKAIRKSPKVKLKVPRDLLDTTSLIRDAKPVSPGGQVYYSTKSVRSWGTKPTNQPTLEPLTIYYLIGCASGNGKIPLWEGEVLELYNQEGLIN